MIISAVTTVVNSCHCACVIGEVGDIEVYKDVELSPDTSEFSLGKSQSSTVSTDHYYYYYYYNRFTTLCPGLPR